MRVLVTAASKHGGTLEIADAIRDSLVREGIEAEAVSPGDTAAIDRYDGVIIGSGIYAGHWLDAAKDFVSENDTLLASRPVWLFSSGPLGDPLKPVEEPLDAAPIAARIGAREHRVFGGRLDRARLSLGERVVLRLVRAPDGDYRPWADIRDWATGIARELVAD